VEKIPTPFEFKDLPALQEQVPSTSKSSNFFKNFNLLDIFQLKSKPEPKPKPDVSSTSILTNDNISPPDLYQALKNSYAKEKAEKLGEYRLDQELSNDNQQVYFNPEAKSGDKLLFTVTGTHNSSDVITDIALGFGNLKNTNRYKEADETLQQAKQKYNTNQAIVAGHSLGGTIASYIANSQDDKIFTLDKGATIGQPVRSKEQAYRTKGDIISIMNAKSTNMQTLPNPNTKSNWVIDPWKAHAVNNIAETPIALISPQSLEIQTSTGISSDTLSLTSSTSSQLIPNSTAILGKRVRLQDVFQPYKLVKADDLNENQLIVSTVVSSISDMNFKNQKKRNRSDLFEPALTYSKGIVPGENLNAVLTFTPLPRQIPKTYPVQETQMIMRPINEMKVTGKRKLSNEQWEIIHKELRKLSDEQWGMIQRETQNEMLSVAPKIQTVNNIMVTLSQKANQKLEDEKTNREQKLQRALTYIAKRHKKEPPFEYDVKRVNDTVKNYIPEKAPEKATPKKPVKARRNLIDDF
jgi:hypothetical protein